MVKLSIIIPAYNEEKRIGKTLENYIKFFRTKKESFEIFVIMDGCIDKTPKIVRELSRKYPEIKHKNYPKRLGKGGAIIKGFGLAKGGFVAYVDADGATPPEELYNLEHKIGNYDGVIGSRWLKESKVVKRQELSRLIASRGFNLLVRLILGLPYKDTQCASKIFRKSVIKAVIREVKVRNFAFDASLLYFLYKYGYDIKEAPITWADKDFSTVSITKAAPRMFITILKLRFRHIFKRKGNN